ncbi:hypothetical protein REPUB_Repub02eG0010300 [Reevesia pubescens]
MHKHLHLLSISVALCTAFALIINEVDGDYLIGVGSYDMTGPAAGVNMMGYANMEQSTAGIHFRLRARTFIVAESSQGARFAFVNLDAGMASQLVTIKVLEGLKTRFGDLYTQENVAISGTHTHAGPAGYLQYIVYSVTSLGFVNQSFDAIVTAVEQSIVQAHNNLKPGSIFLNTGDVEINAGINRSPSAYLFNPPEERAKYPSNVDPTMTLLKFWDPESNKSIGAFSWFATHGTSMSRDNKLISGDNKGAAARHQDTNKESSNNQGYGRTTLWENNQSGLQGEEERWVQICGSILPIKCWRCDPKCARSILHGHWIALYPDEILSTKIIGERQFQKAVELFNSASNQLSGKIDYRHTYLNFTNIEVELDDNTVVKTCPAALGPGFAAGTTDGPGVFGFQQGDTEINEMWKQLRDLLKEPSQYQVDCQKPKAVLLSSGEMFVPYAWAPAILPIQMLRLGNFVILSVPGEFTTMAGRRLREAVKETLISSGNGEFDDETHVVIAGLTNTYSQYVATFEEYKQQRYEAASTLYGPHTLSAYIQEFKKLAKSMATGEKFDGTGLFPPDLSSVQLSLLQDPQGDSPPPGKKFGDMNQDVAQPKDGLFKKGDKPSATFWSANPRYDLLTEGTFAVVEMLQGERWIPVYDDDDFSLYFKWKVDNTSFYGLATIEWEVQEDAASGVYRLRHFGSSKKTKDSLNEYFTGASSAFTVS